MRHATYDEFTCVVSALFFHSKRCVELLSVELPFQSSVIFILDFLCSTRPTSQVICQLNSIWALRVGFCR